jgi:hypothetical protein
MTEDERKSLAIEAAFLVFGDAIVEAELTGPERAALYADILTVHDEMNGFVKDAAEVLKLRIGGAVNLRSYVDCLVAGAARLAAEAIDSRLPEITLEDEREYTLAEGAGVWVAIGLGSLRIKHTGDGVLVELFRKGAEDEDSVNEICEFWGELMTEEDL